MQPHSLFSLHMSPLSKSMILSNNDSDISAEKPEPVPPELEGNHGRTHRSSSAPNICNLQALQPQQLIRTSVVKFDGTLQWKIFFFLSLSLILILASYLWISIQTIIVPLIHYNVMCVSSNNPRMLLLSSTSASLPPALLAADQNNMLIAKIMVIIIIIKGALTSWHRIF